MSVQNPMSAGLVNWHWRNKDKTQWSKDWFRENLLIEDGKVRITSVSDIDGDCELGMRKSKVITVYDFRITCDWEGEIEDEDNATGTITVPEVMHDQDEDDYVFECALTSKSTKQAEALKEQVRKSLSNNLRTKFQEFPKVLMEIHGIPMIKEATAAAAAPPSGASTPKPSAPPPATTAPKSAPSAPSSATAAKPSGKISTSEVKIENAFQITAADLFSLLTDETKVPVWSRNPGKIRPEEGAEISLFGGNVTGKMLSVDSPNSFTSTWRAPIWPADHFGELTATLKQGSDNTTLTLRLTGVPVGMEDETEKGLQAYYIRGLNMAGLGTIL